MDRQRQRTQDSAIQGLLDYGELRAKFAALTETRETAKKELEALRSRRERMVELERDRDALLRSYAGMANLLEEVFSETERRVSTILASRRAAVLTDKRPGEHNKITEFYLRYFCATLQAEGT